MLGEGAGDGRTVLLWMLVLVQRRLLGAGGCGHRVFGDSPVPVAAGDLHLLGLVPAAHSVSCRWPPNVLYLLRVLFCSWSPPPPASAHCCSVGWRPQSGPGWHWELALGMLGGSGSSRDTPARASSMMGLVGFWAMSTIILVPVPPSLSSPGAIMD